MGVASRMQEWDKSKTRELNPSAKSRPRIELLNYESAKENKKADVAKISNEV